MKILFLTIIALVIPLFFLLIFVLGTYNRLATLRRRCNDGAKTLANGERNSGIAQRQEAIEEYNAARSTFPASMIARLFHFEPEAQADSNSPGGNPET